MGHGYVTQVLDQLVANGYGEGLRLHEDKSPKGFTWRVGLLKRVADAPSRHVGVACWPGDLLIADIDNYSEEAKPRILDIVNEMWDVPMMRLKNNKPTIQVFFQNRSGIRKKTTGDKFYKDDVKKGSIVEVLVGVRRNKATGKVESSGQQAVILDPVGLNEIYWVNGSPLDRKVAELPRISYVEVYDLIRRVGEVWGSLGWDVKRTVFKQNSYNANNTNTPSKGNKVSTPQVAKEVEYAKDDIWTIGLTVPEIRLILKHVDAKSHADICATVMAVARELEGSDDGADLITEWLRYIGKGTRGKVLKYWSVYHKYNYENGGRTMYKILDYIQHHRHPAYLTYPKSIRSKFERIKYQLKTKDERERVIAGIKDYIGDVDVVTVSSKELANAMEISSKSLGRWLSALDTGYACASKRRGKRKELTYTFVKEDR